MTNESKKPNRKKGPAGGGDRLGTGGRGGGSVGRPATGEKKAAAGKKRGKGVAGEGERSFDSAADGSRSAQDDGRASNGRGGASGGRGGDGLSMGGGDGLGVGEALGLGPGDFDVVLAEVGLARERLAGVRFVFEGLVGGKSEAAVRGELLELLERESTFSLGKEKVEPKETDVFSEVEACISGALLLLERAGRQDRSVLLGFLIGAHKRNYRKLVEAAERSVKEGDEVFARGEATKVLKELRFIAGLLPRGDGDRGARSGEVARSGDRPQVGGVDVLPECAITDL